MVGYFAWADGKLILRPRWVGKVAASNYVTGKYRVDDTGSGRPLLVGVNDGKGTHPTTKELAFMIGMELNSYGRVAYYAQKIAAGSEDTEPQGDQVGFLKEPHDSLYPPLFRGQKLIPAEVIRKLKDHILDALKEDFDKPDAFLYFTIYGSGLTYVWDEGGDLDIQMWVDIEKYQDSTTDETPMSMDDLLAAVRRRVQTVNFPTFTEVGLDSPDPEATGDMMIQYYAKPGKGTREENLASKPYACYDMETNEWLQEPEFPSPKFYGDVFKLLMPKAEDMAIQAESLLDEYERNILNWQFWTTLATRYKDKAYKKLADESRKHAELEQEGIKNMFESIFGGRAEAYSPTGEGVKDERDIMQKLLEVWGIFQRLKHYARAALPWEEQKVALELVPEFSDDDTRDTPMRFAIGDTVDAVNDPTRVGGKIVDWDEHDRGMYYVRWRGLDLAEFWRDEMLKPSGYDGPRAAKWVATKLAGWADIMEKAQRQRDDGAVQIERNGYDNVVGTVESESRPGQFHQTEIWPSRRKELAEAGNPNYPIAMWNCDCEWGQVSWGRTRQFKKYEGRPCWHGLALYWESVTNDIDDAPEEEEQQGILFDPEAPLPGAIPNALITQPETSQQEQIPSQPIAPQEQPVQLTIPGIDFPGDPITQIIDPDTAFKTPDLKVPGTFSKWHSSAAYGNGDYVRVVQPVDGEDDRGQQYTVPRNTIGEVIWVDDIDAIVIFTTEAGRLGPHHIRVTAPPESFTLVDRTRGTFPKRRR